MIIDRDKVAYIWIFPDPAKAEPTLGVVVVGPELRQMLRWGEKKNLSIVMPVLPFKRDVFGRETGKSLLENKYT